MGLQYAPFRSKVLTLDSFDKTMPYAEAGDSVKMFLRGTNPHNLYRGQTITAPGTLVANKKFEGQTHVLIPDEGGREHTFGVNFKPQVFTFSFRFSTAKGTSTHTNKKCIVFHRIGRCGSKCGIS